MIRFAAALGLSVWAVASHANCREDSVFLRGEWGQARFSVEIADDADERAQGLMFREKLATSAGMLFVYERPQEVAFWMRNTLIPLDLLYIDTGGVVTHIHENAVPGDETPLPSNGVVQMVLEVNGGLTRAMGIAVGSEMQHPAVDQTGAVWPCD